MASNGRLLTTGEVARRLGKHIRKIQRMVESGELPVAEKVGGRHLIDASLVEHLRRQQELEEAKTS